MSKKVPIGHRPSGMHARPSPGAISSWVEEQGGAPSPFVMQAAATEAPAKVPVVVDVPIIPSTPALPKTPEPVEEQKVATPVVAAQEKMKRLTIDIPDSLHRRVKSKCGQEGLKMADVIRELLEKRFKEA